MSEDKLGRLFFTVLIAAMVFIVLGGILPLSIHMWQDIFGGCQP